MALVLAVGSVSSEPVLFEERKSGRARARLEADEGGEGEGWRQELGKGARRGVASSSAGIRAGEAVNDEFEGVTTGADAVDGRNDGRWRSTEGEASGVGIDKDKEASRAEPSEKRVSARRVAMPSQFETAELAQR